LLIFQEVLAICLFVISFNFAKNISKMKNLNKLLCLATIFFSNFVMSQTEPVSKNNVAIGGYDLVSYFKNNKATKGDKKYEVIQNGIKYYFSNQENKVSFSKEASKYLPECDGYCAYGVSEKNAKVSINPETFKIINGKLYLFYNDSFLGKRTNTLLLWNKDEDKQLSKIDLAWQKIKNK
jgi:YHS domain-containing protein